MTSKKQTPTVDHVPAFTLGENDVPVLDYVGTQLTFPILGDNWIAHFSFEVFPNRVFKTLINTVMQGMAVKQLNTRGEVEFLTPSVAGIRERVLKNLIDIHDVEDNASYQDKIAFLKSNPHVIDRCWGSGLDACAAASELEDQIGVKKKLRMFGAGEELPWVNLRHTLSYLADDEFTDVQFDFGFRLAPIELNHRNRYDKASKAIMNTKSATRRYTEDLDVLDILFNEMVIEGTDNLRFDGKPLTKENKDEWASNVWFGHKYAALREHFDPGKVKRT